MKTLKIEINILAKTEAVIREEVASELEKQMNQIRPVLTRNEYLQKLTKQVAKDLGEPSIETVTDLMDRLAPLSRKYSSKGKAVDEDRGTRKQATDSEKVKALADLKAGKKPAQVAKDAGMSTAWAYSLKKTLAGGGKQKAKTKPKA